MIQFDVEAVENIISSSPRKNGSFNLFFKLNDNIAIKLSSKKEQRDHNYKTQKRAAENGLGPDVYGTIDNIKYEGQIYYGYFTEVVWTIPEVNYLHWRVSDLLRKSMKEDINNLVDSLAKIGYSFWDFHLGNIGVKNEKLVCIDFDSPNRSERKHVDYKEQY